MTVECLGHLHRLCWWHRGRGGLVESCLVAVLHGLVSSNHHLVVLLLLLNPRVVLSRLLVGAGHQLGLGLGPVHPGRGHGGVVGQVQLHLGVVGVGEGGLWYPVSLVLTHEDPVRRHHLTTHLLGLAVLLAQIILTAKEHKVSGSLCQRPCKRSSQRLDNNVDVLGLSLQLPGHHNCDSIQHLGESSILITIPLRVVKLQPCLLADMFSNVLPRLALSLVFLLHDVIK